MPVPKEVSQKSKRETIAVLTLIASQLIQACYGIGLPESSSSKKFTMQQIIPPAGENLTSEKKAEIARLKNSFIKASKDSIGYLADNNVQSTDSSKVEKKGFNEIIRESTGIDASLIKGLDPAKGTIVTGVGATDYNYYEITDDTSGKTILVFFGTNDGGKTWNQTQFVRKQAIMSNKGSRIEIVADVSRDLIFSSPEDFKAEFGGFITPGFFPDGKFDRSMLLVNPKQINSDGQEVASSVPTAVAVNNNERTYIKPVALVAVGGIFETLFKDSILPVVQNPPPIAPPEQPATAVATATEKPLNVTPEVKAVIDAQKAPYKVNESGEAIIMVRGKEVVLKNLVDTKTDFGLAQDILNGVDADGTRYLFTEKGGWAKVIEPGTPEKRTKVFYKDFENGVVNASAALLYAQNPTIPKGAIDPQWWVTAGGSKEIGGYIGQLTLMPLDNNKLVTFKKSTQPYGSPTLWLEFSKDGKSFVTAVQPNKNPSSENKNQLINMNWTFDKDRFDQKQKGVVDDLVDYLVNGKVSFRSLIAADSSRPSVLDRATYLYGPDGAFDSQHIQKQGEILSLFTSDEQMAIKAVWEKDATVAWGQIPNSEADVKIAVLPQDLSLKPLTADYISFTWGDIQP